MGQNARKSAWHKEANVCSSTCLDRGSLDSARLGAVQTNATAVTASKNEMRSAAIMRVVRSTVEYAHRSGPKTPVETPGPAKESAPANVNAGKKIPYRTYAHG